MLQIAALGVWQIVTGRPMVKPLEPVDDPRRLTKEGHFVTLKKQNSVRGSMGVFESSTILPETLFSVAQTAATHDQRFPPVKEEEISDLDIEVTLMSHTHKLQNPQDLEIGTMGLMISRGEKQGVLLPKVDVEQNWAAEQFLEACCEKAQLSHKAWKDPNTLVEVFQCVVLEGGSLVKLIEDMI